MEERNILVTSLGSIDDRTDHRFFYIKEGKFTEYCDAIGVAEAGTKYILDRVSIDEIIVLGTGATYKPGDELRHIRLREFVDYDASGTESLSEYSFFRYRISQYLDDLDLEGSDVYENIDPGHKEELIEIYRNFAEKSLAGEPEGGDPRNKMFHILTRDRGRYEKLCSMLPEETRQEDMAWLHRYIYNQLSDDFKLRALPENDDLEICFIPTTTKRVSMVPLENIRQIVDAVNHSGADRINLYMDMQGIGFSTGSALIHILAMLSDDENGRFSIREIITTEYDADSFASPINNKGLRSIRLNQLVSGMKAFIEYGKVETIRNYWDSLGIHNDHIEKLLYGMKCVDDGISLCQIGDLEYGINVLKRVFSETPVDDLPEMESNIFTIIEEMIRADYGALLEGDDIDSLELIKWAYRKHLYQQVMTVIESRIPKELVCKGILYYAIDEDSKVAMLEELAQEYFDTGKNNRWNFDDIDHYFIKYYGRPLVNGKQSPEDRSREYAKLRRESVFHGREGMIKAWSWLEDKPDLLENVMLAYYMIAPIRNLINHAQSDRPAASLDDIDIHRENERLAKLTGAINDFINAYETALAERVRGDAPALIDRKEFREYIR